MRLTIARCPSLSMSSSARPSTALVSSTVPTAAISGSAFDTREPSTRPVVPFPPVRVYMRLSLTICRSASRSEHQKDDHDQYGHRLQYPAIAQQLLLALAPD